MATQTGSLDLKGMTSAYSDQQQYFWVESSSSATWGGGAHITNIAESAFKTAAGTWGTDPTAGGYNLLMNTDTANATGSLQLRNGSLPIMNLDNDSLDFNTIDITGGTYRTVASFGETTQIGYDDETKMILSSNSFDMVDINELSISHIGNPTNQLLLDVFFYDSAQTNPNIFVLSETPTTIEQVTINDVVTTNYTLHDLNQVTINDTLTDGDKISITYKFAGETSYYTFGYRKDGGGTEEDDYFTVGQYSFASGCLISATGTASHAEGYNTEAKGHSSHAEGHETIAWKDHAHAEGDGCQAEGEASHAEGRDTIASGIWSHAEGRDTTASGRYSHAEGRATIASGSGSHAGGVGTIAKSSSQTVIGEWNEVIEQGESTVRPPAFILGNGTSDTNRSNALIVYWNGTVKMAGSIEVAGHITSAITACGNNSTPVSLTTSEKIIPMTTYRYVVGSQLSVSDNGILCGKDGFVEVAGNIYFIEGVQNGDIVHLIIKKGSTNVLNAPHRIAGTYDYYSAAPIIIQVSAGDMFYLYTYNQTAARGKASASLASWLTVKYL